MKYFLAKTDPETYSIDQFEREKKTVLDGFTDPQALRAISEMRPGDRVFLNHSGGEAAVVGLVSVVSEPFGSKRLQAHRSRSRISVPARATATLHGIKESSLFSDWTVVRQGRLSTMATPESFVAWIKKNRS